MTSAKRTLRSIEEHLQLGLPVLFSELLVFKWTPIDGFPIVSDDFRAGFERMHEVENLENELRVFFDSFGGASDVLGSCEVRRNVFKFLDQYGTIADILKNDLLRLPLPSRSLVPEYLEERIRNQTKWFKGKDDFSLDFSKEFLRRKFCTMRTSFRAPQPASLLPPVPPPRRNRSTGSTREPEPSTSQAVSAYTASGRLRRNSAPTSFPQKPRRITAEELPSPPPTPPPLRQQAQEIGVAQENELGSEFVDEESRNEEAQIVPSTPPSNRATSDVEADQTIPQETVDEILENNNNLINEDREEVANEDRIKNMEQPAVKSKIKSTPISGGDKPLQETAM